MMGLWERRDTKVGTFSKGMKQRLALARALVHEPKVLFLDEPTAGLDPAAAREVREMVKGLSRAGRTIFLSTHNLAEAEFLCHRIAVVKTRLLALDTAENLRQRLFRRQIVVQLESLPSAVIEKVTRLPFVRRVEPGEKKLLVELDDPDRNRPELVQRIVEAGGRVMAVSEEQHSLEEVYLSLVRENEPHD
jgi:ABC-2 type transport system ATP-binding protein